MKKIITTALATLVAVYGYSQDGVHLPLTGGTLTGSLKLYTGGYPYIDFGASSTNYWRFLYDNPEDKFLIQKDGVTRLSIGADGRLSGTYASFTGNLGISSSSDSRIYMQNTTPNTGRNWNLISDIDGAYRIGIYGVGNFLTINSDGNTNLSGTFTGTSATLSAHISARGHSALINDANGASWSETAVEVQGSNNPGVGFHWPGQYGASLYMTSNGTLSWNGAGISVPKILSTGHSAFVNNSNGASWSESALEVQGSNNPGIGFHWPGQYAASLYMDAGGNLKWGGNGIVANGSISVSGGSFSNNVNIGTTQTDANLTVKGKILSKEVKVEATVLVPDYVFEKSYNLKPLAEVEKYIAENKHLPEVPSAKVIKKEGINVGEMQMKLLQKIEELTLHLIEQNKLNIEQNKSILEQNKLIQQQSQRILELEKEIK